MLGVQLGGPFPDLAAVLCLVSRIAAAPETAKTRTDGILANHRRTEFLRPEGLLPVSAVAERLGVSVPTVHAAINAGELRWVLFGSVRRVRPEDLEAYVQSRSGARPPANEDWFKVADLMRATGFSRSKAYRLIERGILPFKVFAGTRYIRSENVGVLPRQKGQSGDSFMIPPRTGVWRTTAKRREEEVQSRHRVWAFPASEQIPLDSFQ